MGGGAPTSSECRRERHRSACKARPINASLRRIGEQASDEQRAQGRLNLTASAPQECQHTRSASRFRPLFNQLVVWGIDMAKKVTLEVVLSRADGFRPKEIVRLQFDPLEAKKAVNTGLKTVKKFDKRLRKDFPGFEVDVLTHLPSVCDALLSAQRRAKGGSSAAGSREIINAATKWRRVLLPQAQSLAEAGKIDANAVSKIERGLGATDTAQDVAELVELLLPLRDSIELSLGAGALRRAQLAANEALAALGSVGSSDEEAEDDRDRLATLIIQLHERLRSAVAAVTSFHDATTLVPSLSTGGGAKVAPESAPAKPENEE